VEVNFLMTSSNPVDFVRVPVASATVITKGQLVSWESNKGVLMDLVTEDATFIGVAYTETRNGETDDIVVCQNCVVEIDSTSAAYNNVGAGLKYAAGDASTAYSLVDDGGANTIAWNHKAMGASAVTRIQARVNVPALSKLYEVNA